MKCDIYAAKDDQDNHYVFLAIPHREDAEHLPEEHRDKFTSVKFLGSQDLASEKLVLGVDPKEIERALESKGFYTGSITFSKFASTFPSMASALGGGLIAGSLLSIIPGLGPIGWLSGAALGYFIARKAKGGK